MKKITVSVATLSAWLFTSQTVLAATTRIESQTSLSSLQEVVEAIFKTMIVFVPAVATIYVVISGYRYMIAQGNPDLVEKAKKSLTYALLGAGIAYTSVLIILLITKKIGFTSPF